jgi:hypothetical protein
MRRFALGVLVALCLGAAAAPARGDSTGAIDSPADGATVFGVVPVRGWFLDTNPVDNIQIFVDGTCANLDDSGCHNVAQMNIPRSDVLIDHPDFSPNATPNPGFLGYFEASHYSNGPHSLAVVATESNNPGNPVTFATITVNVDNSINQAPFGDIESPTGDAGVIEGANSAFLVQGWVLDDVALSGNVSPVVVLVDGHDVVGAICCSPRPDIQAIYPGVPNSLYSGWSAYIDSTALINGTHTISVRATDNQGASAIIGTRTVQVDNASLNLHPFGELQYPLDESTVPAVCGKVVQVVTSGGCPVSPPQVCQIQSTGCLSVNRANLNPVTGWVLDTGARLDQGQTAYVQFLIDGVIIADTRRDCVLLSGAFANCYGVNRPDVEKRFPGFVNSDNAGFVFDFAAVDDGTGHLGIYVPAGSGTTASVCLRYVTTIVPGKHDFSIRAGDVAETVSQIGNPISVDFTTGCNNVTSIDQPGFGDVEAPADFAFLTGAVTVSGWAFDPDGFSCDPRNAFSHIDVDIDGHYEDIVTKQPCGVPCPPDSSCTVLPNCEPSAPGSSITRDDHPVQWCEVRPDVPVHDIRVPITFTSPNPPCTDQPATWGVVPSDRGQARVGWSFTLETQTLANTAHDLNVYASDCNGNRVLIGRRKFVVFNDLTRGTVSVPPAAAAPAPVVRSRP